LGVSPGIASAGKSATVTLPYIKPSMLLTTSALICVTCACRLRSARCLMNTAAADGCGLSSRGLFSGITR